MCMYKTGDYFQATDKLGKTFTYMFAGISPDDSGREIVLQNIELDEETRVEAEWFRQRKIKDVI